MKTQKCDTRDIQNFSKYQLQNSYINLIKGGERKATTKAYEDIE